MEAHADRLGSLDLGVEQVATVLRVEIQVIGAGGATTEREFGKTHPRRHVGRFLVKSTPQWVERLQPSEQRLRRHQRQRASEVLVEVMVGVDETRRDETPLGVDHLRSPRMRVR